MASFSYNSPNADSSLSCVLQSNTCEQRPVLLARTQLGGRMAERSDPPPGGGGTARPGAAIGGQPQQKKKKPKYPAGCPVVEANGTFDITEPSSGATITVRRTCEGTFWLQLVEERLGVVARMGAIFNAHPQWKLPARRLHQPFDQIGTLTRGKVMQKQKQKQKCGATANCTSNLVAHIALVSKQPLRPSERCHLSSLMSSTLRGSSETMVG